MLRLHESLRFQAEIQEPFQGHRRIFRIEFHPIANSPQHFSGNDGCAGPEKDINHGLRRLGVKQNVPRRELDGKGSGMPVLSGDAANIIP